MYKTKETTDEIETLMAEIRRLKATSVSEKSTKAAGEIKEKIMAVFELKGISKQKGEKENDRHKTYKRK